MIQIDPSSRYVTDYCDVFNLVFPKQDLTKKEGLSPFLLTLVEDFLHEFLGPLNGPTVPSITARYQDEHGREISNLPSHELAGNRQHGNRIGGDEGQLETLDEHFRVKHSAPPCTNEVSRRRILLSYFTNIIYALFR